MDADVRLGPGLLEDPVDGQCCLGDVTRLEHLQPITEGGATQW
jgi:hypothetical protein